MHILTPKQQRAKRIRGSIKAYSDRLRLTVSRSNKFMSAQIIDDVAQKTLVGVHEKHLENAPKTKTERAMALGELVAGKAQEAKIKTVVFDKGPYRYHGRVRAFAEGARKGGLDF